MQHYNFLLSSVKAPRSALISALEETQTTFCCVVSHTSNRVLALNTQTSSTTTFAQLNPQINTSASSRVNKASSHKDPRRTKGCKQPYYFHKHIHACTNKHAGCSEQHQDDRRIHLNVGKLSSKISTQVFYHFFSHLVPILAASIFFLIRRQKNNEVDSFVTTVLGLTVKQFVC